MNGYDWCVELARWPDDQVLVREKNTTGIILAMTNPTIMAEITIRFEEERNCILDAQINFRHQKSKKNLKLLRKRLSWFICSTLPPRLIPAIWPHPANVLGTPRHVSTEIARVLDPSGPVETLALERHEALLAERHDVSTDSLHLRILALMDPSLGIPQANMVRNWPVPGIDVYAGFPHTSGLDGQKTTWAAYVDGTDPIGSGRTPGEALRMADFLVWPEKEEEWKLANQNPGELLVDPAVWLLLDEIPDFWRRDFLSE